MLSLPLSCPLAPLGGVPDLLLDPAHGLRGLLQGWCRSAWFVGRPSNCCEAGPSGSRERERQFRDDYNDDFGKARRLRWRRPLSGLVVPARSVLAATQMPGEAAGWFRDTADAVENFFWALEDYIAHFKLVRGSALSYGLHEAHAGICLR
ncbi:uncharacterized protein [Oryza sativa Japonica Group]|uniref:uncharacterized protein isoform X1 n=1 Tax=Oryza sativa subsp. japonica TaxID=39947 RepID=UPI0007755644|nr:uncharacterized protein LOC4350020 isoform X1 [Oryza sativa Japonica Group]